MKNKLPKTPEIKVKQEIPSEINCPKMSLEDKSIFVNNDVKDRLYPEKDVKKAVKELIDEIENAQEDYANLEHISKEQVVIIIKKHIGDGLTK